LGVKTEGGGEGKGDTNIFIHAIDSRSMVDMLRNNRATVVSLINDELTSNGSLRSTIRRTL
jgi:hypothetical protein